MGNSQSYISGPNNVVVCVNGRSAPDFSGVLYHNYSEEGSVFKNTDDMIFTMEKLFNWLNFPHAATNDRTFGEETTVSIRQQTERTKIMSDDRLLQKHGDIGTFIVRVQHRENSSWQGRITWIEEDRTISFRSVFEMLKLMESAIDSVSVPEEEEGTNWFEK